MRQKGARSCPLKGHRELGRLIQVTGLRSSFREKKGSPEHPGQGLRASQGEGVAGLLPVPEGGWLEGVSQRELPEQVQDLQHLESQGANHQALVDFTLRAERALGAPKQETHGPDGVLGSPSDPDLTREGQSRLCWPGSPQPGLLPREAHLAPSWFRATAL